MHAFRKIVRRRGGRRATAAVQTAVLVTVVLGTGALAVDLGAVFAAQADLQDAVGATTDEGMLIYTVSVGDKVDRAPLQESVTIDHGQEVYAVGNPEDCTAQRDLTFRPLGGRCAVDLFE